MDVRGLARAHGAFNVLFGAWPLVHMRSFEWVSGPKTEHWLVQTVGALLVTNGSVQLSTTGGSPAELAVARRVGIGTALALAGISLRYGANGRVSRIYLLDGAVELGWAVAWVLVGRRGST